MSKKRKKLYFDMDGVLVDFESGIRRLPAELVRQFDGRLDEVPGIFGLMDPLPGAVDAVHTLARQYDVYILSTAPWKNPSAWADKVRFIHRHFPEVFHKRLILSHHKDLLKGDILIDDRPDHGADSFKGEWIRFGSERYPDWNAVLDYLDTGEDLDREEYEEDIRKVTASLVRKINETYPDPKPDGYPSSWKPVDRLAYEYGCLAHTFDEIDPLFSSWIDRLISQSCEGTSVSNLDDVRRNLLDYLEERSNLKKIQEYYLSHN